MNLGEPKRIPKRQESHKPINGKGKPKTLWQSEQSVVVKKQGNACGAKGLSAMQRDLRDTFAGHRAREQMGTKLKTLTERAEENPQCKFTSLAQLLSEDFLKGCF